MNRKDFTERLKELRGAGLYPTARRVGDKGAAPLTEKHCANVILSLITSYSAMGCAERVKRHGELQYLDHAYGDGIGWLISPDDGRKISCVRDVLATMIWNLRRGIEPWTAKWVTGLIARLDEPAGFLIELTDREPGDDGSNWIEYYRFGDEAAQQHNGLGNMRDLPGAIIGWMVEFLGPVEDDA